MNCLRWTTLVAIVAVRCSGVVWLASGRSLWRRMVGAAKKRLALPHCHWKGYWLVARVALPVRNQYSCSGLPYYYYSWPPQHCHLLRARLRCFQSPGLALLLNQSLCLRCPPRLLRLAATVRRSWSEVLQLLLLWVGRGHPLPVVESSFKPFERLLVLLEI